MVKSIKARARVWPLAAALALLSSLVASDGARAFGPTVIKAATSAHRDSPLGRQLRRFERRLEQQSNGQVQVKVFTGGSLGDDRRLAERVAEGSLQVFAGPVEAMAEKAPELAFLGSAYLFADERHADRALDGALGAEISAVLESRGLVLGMWAELGFRSWYTKQAPLRGPAELRALRLRVGQSGSAGAELLRSLGAVPVEFEAREVEEGLANGRLDGFEATPTEALASSWYRRAGHLTLSRHRCQVGLVAYSRRWFRGLPERHQQALGGLPGSLTARQRDESRALSRQHLEVLRGRGVQVHEPDGAEQGAFAAAARASRERLAAKLGHGGRQMLDAVESAR